MFFEGILMCALRMFAFSLLIASSCALARVQLDTHVTVKDASQSMQIISTRMQLSANEQPVMTQTVDTIQVEERLLAEYENEARVRCTISAKNAAGEYEVISRPEFLVSYGQDAKMEMTSTNGNSIYIALKAGKI